MTKSEAINLLPTDPDAIAQHLLELGCLGCRRNNTCCPLFAYLEKMCGREYMKYEKVNTWGVPSDDIQTLDYFFPKHVATFAANFDKGDYEFLQHQDTKTVYKRPRD